MSTSSSSSPFSSSPSPSSSPSVSSSASAPRSSAAARAARPTARALSVVLGLSLVAGAGCLADEPGAAPAELGAASVDLHKPQPVRPPTAPGVITDGALPAKPVEAGALAAPGAAFTWTVALSASTAWLWPTQYSTLTATTNADVLRTPYYIVIKNANTGAQVAACGGGTTCSIAAMISAVSRVRLSWLVMRMVMSSGASQRMVTTKSSLGA